MEKTCSEKLLYRKTLTHTDFKPTPKKTVGSFPCFTKVAYPYSLFGTEFITASLWYHMPPSNFRQFYCVKHFIVDTGASTKPCTKLRPQHIGEFNLAKVSVEEVCPLEVGAPKSERFWRVDSYVREIHVLHTRKESGRQSLLRATRVLRDKDCRSKEVTKRKVNLISSEACPQKSCPLRKCGPVEVDRVKI